MARHAAALAVALAIAAPGIASPGAAPPETPGVPEQEKRPTAPVVVDGRVLFHVIGVPVLPAAERAGAIAERIERLAADRSFDPGALELAEVPLGTSIQARGENVVTLTDHDAAATGHARAAIAPLIRDQIGASIRLYRQERTPESLVRAAGWAAGWTVALLLLTWVASRLARRLQAAAERWFAVRSHLLQVEGLPLVSVARAHGVMLGILRGGRTVIHLGSAIAYAAIVLALFPWTRGAARVVVPVVLGPLVTVGRGFLAELPNLVFLLVLWLLVRWVLRLVRTFFGAVEAGTIRLSGFYQEWAHPTYRIVRVVLIAFALVLAYPYIPGSGSGVFKGLSIFVGVLFSLGSSSIVANVIAGYTLTYRRAFRAGDRVKIGDVVGDVEETKVLVTRVRTLKNEEVVIPNSAILAGNVVNYTALAGKEGVIVHVTVGIGYETPWRQVEAMLLEAAARASGIERAPPPFVLYQELGDFCVVYEINGYTRDAHRMAETRTALQREVLDVFNAYGVQIMTPAYVADPAQPKLVPRDQWYAAPARPAGQREPATDPEARDAPVLTHGT